MYVGGHQTWCERDGVLQIAHIPVFRNISFVFLLKVKDYKLQCVIILQGYSNEIELMVTCQR